jgi:myo-inositol-1(or 4)-monophosphatase
MRCEIIMKSEQEEAINKRLDVIESMLPEVERFLLELQSGDFGIKVKSNTFDLVTEGDVACEAQLTKLITENFPEDDIMGEESGGNRPESTDAFCWILDPIDGTTNYANRIPMWAISIGLTFAGEPVGGVVSAPALNLRYRAALGCGATCNGDIIGVNTKAPLGNGVVVTGFPYDRARRAEPLSQALANILREAGGVRRMGAASLDFCFVADGRFVGYYEILLKPWDAAGGWVIAHEAGAKLTNMDGSELNIFESKGTVVTNGLVHEELLAQIGPMKDALAMGPSID